MAELLCRASTIFLATHRTANPRAVPARAQDVAEGPRHAKAQVVLEPTPSITSPHYSDNNVAHCALQG
jgi:hypothetical protein